MSNRRSSSSTTSSDNQFSDDEINNLIYNLQSLLPNSGAAAAPASRTRRPPVETWKVLEEICNYIKRLHRDVDDLTRRLSQLLSSVDINSLDPEILRSLLQQ
ncbi:hypothetical protein M9H77_04900 [Catharanthus roseus]|uniref:Uncharacterized protein n=1 Tax=Catharanthus roseus TaxID=4058 RepID=A0ACC0CFP6_CATRO|nr:hypothetical protein M9H77_04900 [Catharanthus roseus]